MEYSTRRVQRDRAVGLDPGVMPPVVLVPPDGRHVVGEYAAKARIYQHLRPLGYRDGSGVDAHPEFKLLAGTGGHAVFLRFRSTTAGLVVGCCCGVAAVIA